MWRRSGEAPYGGVTVELHQVRYFLALCDTLNFTRAAEKCNVSQPSLTRAVKALEDELGGPLFHRERNNTHLTDLGTTMRPFLEQATVQLEQAKQRARGFIRLESAPLKLGVLCTIGPARVSSFLERFRSENPGVEIHLQDGSAAALQERLDQGDLDIALLSRPDGLDDRFHAMKLYDERLMIALAPGHRLANQKSIRFEQLAGERYLGRTDCEYSERAASMMDGVLRPYRGQREDWLQQLALDGVGFCCMGEFSSVIDGLALRPIEPEMKRTIHLVSVRGRPHSPAVGAFLRLAIRQKWS